VFGGGGARYWNEVCSPGCRWQVGPGIGDEEGAAFQLNSYPKDTDPAGKPRSMMHAAFCPGAVKRVELSISHASSALLQRRWVFELPKDQELRIEKLAGPSSPAGGSWGASRAERRATS
jgi:hypothetical protein